MGTHILSGLRTHIGNTTAKQSSRSGPTLIPDNPYPPCSPSAAPSSLRRGRQPAAPPPRALSREPLSAHAVHTPPPQPPPRSHDDNPPLPPSTGTRYLHFQPSPVEHSSGCSHNEEEHQINSSNRSAA